MAYVTPGPNFVKTLTTHAFSFNTCEYWNTLCITNGNYVSIKGESWPVAVAIPHSADSSESGTGRNWDHDTGVLALMMSSSYLGPIRARCNFGASHALRNQCQDLVLTIHCFEDGGILQSPLVFDCHWTTTFPSFGDHSAPFSDIFAWHCLSVTGDSLGASVLFSSPGACLGVVCALAFNRL